jgi:lysophospholipase L1-like esterase
MLFCLTFFSVVVFAQDEASWPQWARDWKAYMTPRMMRDFGDTDRYRKANADLAPAKPGENRVVFMGDSITEGWHLNEFFAGKPYVNRGIGGQVTAQMLVRFRQDVVNLHPRVVVINGGINDVSGIIQKLSVEDIESNYASMAELARANKVQVVFGSVLPIHNYTEPARGNVEWRHPDQVLALNAWLRNYCAQNGFIFADYFSAVVDEKGMLKLAFSSDGLHPNEAGYKAMAPVVEAAIQQAIKGERASVSPVK